MATRVMAVTKSGRPRQQPKREAKSPMMAVRTAIKTSAMKKESQPPRMEGGGTKAKRSFHTKLMMCIIQSITPAGVWNKGHAPPKAQRVGCAPVDWTIIGSRGREGGKRMGVRSCIQWEGPGAGGGGGGGVGTRPWWLALLACGGPYWPLAFEPSAMPSMPPYSAGIPLPEWESRMHHGPHRREETKGGLKMNFHGVFQRVLHDILSSLSPTQVG